MECDDGIIRCCSCRFRHTYSHAGRFRSTLSYEVYPSARNCLMRVLASSMWGKFACFPDIEEAKTLIKQFRAEGYTSYDSVERNLPAWEYVCLNRHEQQRIIPSSHSMQRVS